VWPWAIESRCLFLGSGHVLSNLIREYDIRLAARTFSNFTKPLSQLIKSPATTRYSFEAFLLLAVLANYHRVDAASLNPYLKHIRETRDDVLMHGLLWVTRFACARSIK
jgi:hypothetical protein